MPKQTTKNVTDEVSEYKGALLVRLGRGCAMQMRVRPNLAGVMFRIVPISNALQLDDDSPWQDASNPQLSAWIHPDSAIGQWLLAQGIDGDRIAEQSLETALPAKPRPRRPSFLALRSKSSLSLP